MSYNLKNIKQKFKSEGIFYTPKELALYIKSFLPDGVDKIYDPTCGDGALLEVFNNDVLKYGQDISAEQINVAKDKLNNSHLFVGDTLKRPALTDIKFDYIVANPPFSISWEPFELDPRFNKAGVLPPKSKADWAFMLHILDFMSEKGLAVVMNFPGVLYRGNSEGIIRKWFIDNNYIEKVVSIGGDRFVDTKIRTCLIVLNKNKQNDDVLFINDELKKERIVSKTEIVANNYDLSVQQYVFEEKIKEYIDPIELHNNARKVFLRQLECELEFDAMVCGFEKINQIDYLNQIDSIVKKYRGVAVS